MSGNETEYIITEAQLTRLFEWPGCDEEQEIAAAIRRRKVTLMSGGTLLVDIPCADLDKYGDCLRDGNKCQWGGKDGSSCPTYRRMVRS
nr:hypothetical protein [uncultured Methanoregula sp.]